MSAETDKGYPGKDVVLGLAEWLIDPVPEEVSTFLPDIDDTAAQALARPPGVWLAKEALHAVGLGLHPAELIRAGGQDVERSSSVHPKAISAPVSSIRSGMYRAIAENAELLPNEQVVLRYVVTGETVVGGIARAVGEDHHSVVRDRTRYKLQFLRSPLVSEDMLERLKPRLLSSQQQQVREMLEWGKSAAEIARELGKSTNHINNTINAINRNLGTDYTHTPRGTIDHRLIIEAFGDDNFSVWVTTLSQAGLPPRQIASLLDRRVTDVRLAKRRAYKTLHLA